jgi:3',5'-cyclic AMP phosphodiesterase CpdA
MKDKYHKKTILVIFIAILVISFIFSQDLKRPINAAAMVYSYISNLSVSPTEISYYQERNGYVCIKAYPYFPEYIDPEYPEEPPFPYTDYAHPINIYKSSIELVGPKTVFWQGKDENGIMLGAGLYMLKVMIYSAPNCGWPPISSYAESAVFEISPPEISPSDSWSFAIISDLHVGQYYPNRLFPDYGSPGWDDGNSSSENNSAVKNLEEIINLINSDTGKYNLKFVIVTGDFSDSAELSELYKAEDILNSLNIPWIPIIGNHDVWPFYGVNPDPINREAEMAPKVGELFDSVDRYFNSIFGSKFEELSDNFQDWGKEGAPIFNPFILLNSYFQNFFFDFGNYHFIGLDFNSRDMERWPVKGAAAEGNLNNFSGGTWNWLQNHLQQYINEHPDGGKNIILLAHHSFRKNYWQQYYGIKLYNIGFSDDELKVISDDLAPYKDRIFALFAGHTHENKITSLGNVVKSIETAANVSNPLARIVQFFPNGDINYSDMLGYSLTITAHSPVDLEITDPDGLVINKQINQIPDAEYLEEDIDGNGDLSDRIQILNKKLGDYKIQVIPDINASADATYSLDVSELENSFGYIPTDLAENVPLSQIPTEPYLFEVKQKNTTQLTYSGNLSGQYSDLINLSATLVDNNGNALVGKNITFQIGEQLISAATDASGIASANLTLAQEPGKYYLVETTFVGDADNLPSYNSASFEISKEDVVISVLSADGFALATTTLKAQILDGDGNVLLGDPRAVEFRVGDRAVGKTNIDVKGEAKIDWNVDIIPKNLTETYKISASFVGDENYLSSQGEATLILKSAQWLKKDAIIKLGVIGQDDLLVSQAIKNIQNSLSNDLWLDASHLSFIDSKDCVNIDLDGLDLEGTFALDPSTIGVKLNCVWQKFGLRVFYEEYMAAKLLSTDASRPNISTELKVAFNQTVAELVKADQLLAKIALYEAKQKSIQNPKLKKTIDKLIQQAKKELSKADDEIQKQKPDKAILRLAKVWLYAQGVKRLTN